MSGEERALPARSATLFGRASTIVMSLSIPPTDADLVTAARTASGEDSAAVAFAELVRRYQRMVYALGLSLVREPDDADDLVQDAFVRAFRNLDLLADPAKFGVWLRRIAFGVGIDRIRADRARRLRAIEPSDKSPMLPLEHLERAEVASRVLAALDRLPARYRVPLTLYHIDGLSHAKVAQALGAPEGTVRSLVARARRKLAVLLADHPEVRDMVADPAPSGVPFDVLDEPPAMTPRFMHVLNGDTVRGTLERSDLPGALAVYADILHEGPVPATSGTAASRETRARHIATSGYAPYAEAVGRFEEWDEGLARFADYDEVVLWFEHDLFDQLLLVRHLGWFARRDRGRTTLSLICIGEFPGFAPFHGLGQLDVDQLSSLLGTRERVSADQLELGSRVWQAFTAADPSALDAETRRLASGGGALPFLPGALQRLLEEYPAAETGLARTERHILECLVGGPLSPQELFLAEQRCEERVFMGDWSFWRIVRGLADGLTPLVELRVEAREEPGLPPGTVIITTAGREVLAGRSDWVRLAGIDRWLGGVHLSAPVGGDVAWRYDPVSGGLTRVA